MIDIEIDNESHQGISKIYLNEEEAIKESMRKECIVAYF